ncbi:MAG: extracellular solute-binding protein [Bifidobacteriaceae bacterium]|nr:extracellular solute-binding protein [Bifidobacteriaceae bacterium]
MVAAALMGCAPSSGSKTDSTSEAPSSVSTEVATQAKIRVAGWDDSAVSAGIIEEFEKKYPNIDVEYEFTSAADYQKTISLNMQSDNPPDVAQYNTPMRDLNAAGLILDLEPYASEYGWNDLIASSLLDQTRFSDDGKRMGEGRLIAAPYLVPVLGVFVNKTLEAQAGLDAAPSDLDAFEANLKKAKDGGLLPLMIGALDYGGIHNWAGVLNSYCEPAVQKDWLFGKAGASLDIDCAKQATSRFQEWFANGYYPADANGTADTDAAARFAAGEAVYIIDGSWQGGMFEKELGAGNVGFYLLPHVTADGPSVTNASVAAYSVSAKTQHPDAAAAFLNFMFSPEAGKVITDSGQLSCNPAANEGLTGVNGEIAAGFAKVVEDDAALVWPDQAAPTLLDLITADIQLLFGEKKTAQEMVVEVQADWAEYHQ